MSQQYIVNAAPMVIDLGISDKSTVALPREIEQTAQHIPKFYIYAEKGPQTPQLLGGNERITMYGESTFDTQKKYATHATIFSNKIAAEGNVCMYQRLIPDNTETAGLRISVDITDDAFNKYLRDVDTGKVIRDPETGDLLTSSEIINGKTIQWIEEKFPKSEGLGKATTVGTKSPIIEFVASHPGSYGNNLAITMWAPTRDFNVISRSYIDKERVYPFRISISTYDENNKTFKRVSTLLAEYEITVSFKPYSKDPFTNGSIYIKDTFLQAYEDFASTTYPKLYGPLGDIYIYEDNLKNLLQTIYNTELGYITIDPLLSPYNTWLAGGGNGTEADFLLSLVGTAKSTAYELWLLVGNNGTFEDFLNFLNATNTYAEWLVVSGPGAEETYLLSLTGNSALTAYDIWSLANNNTNAETFLTTIGNTTAFAIWQAINPTQTKVDYILSLAGVGADAYTIWTLAGNPGTVTDFKLWLAGTTGATGTTYYDIWKNAGHTETEDEFLILMFAKAKVNATGYDIWLKANPGQSFEDFLVAIGSVNNSFSLWQLNGHAADTEVTYLLSLTGKASATAYDIWKLFNVNGTIEDFLTAICGKTTYSIWNSIPANATGTELDYLTYLSDDISTIPYDPILGLAPTYAYDSINGPYNLWLKAGNSGSLEDFLATMKGVYDKKQWLDFSDDPFTVLEPYIMNPFSCKAFSGAEYETVRLYNNSTIFLNQRRVELGMGADGDIGQQYYDEAVYNEILRYADPNDELQELAIHVESIFYDTGFNIDYKYHLANFISERHDTFLVLSTYSWDNDVMLSAEQEKAAAIGLRTYLQNYRESDYFGTPLARAMIMGGSGYLRNSNYSKRVPASIELAIKSARCMGNSTGRWVNGFNFDSAPNNIVSTLYDVNLKWVPPTVRNIFWDIGLNWIQAYDRKSYMFPALRTVYDDDTSVLSSYFTVMAICYLNKIAHASWRDFTGISHFTNEQLVIKVNDYITSKSSGIFDGRFTIVPSAYVTEMDKLRGYSITVPIKIYAANMKTVATVYIESHRIDELTTA
jgi:hypothetical protein